MLLAKNEGENGMGMKEKERKEKKGQGEEGLNIAELRLILLGSSSTMILFVLGLNPCNFHEAIRSCDFLFRDLQTSSP